MGMESEGMAVDSWQSRCMGGGVGGVGDEHYYLVNERTLIIVITNIITVE